MNRRPTPETDKAKCKFTSLFGDDEDAYWVPLKVAIRLELERDELRADLEFRRGLFKLQEQQLNEVRLERDLLQDQLAAAMMSIRLQQRREQQTNEKP